MIGIVSGIGLGIIYYFLTMSMLPTHFDAAVELAPHYLLTSIGLTVAISSLVRRGSRNAWNSSVVDGWYSIMLHAVVNG